jgi:hypothetical protein
LSVFKFGEIRVDVHRTGPDPLSPNSDFYAIKISHDDAFVESLSEQPKANRTAGSDFSIAAEALSGMYVTAVNPEGWAAEMQSRGLMSQEEIDAVAHVSQALRPYMNEAMESTRGRFEMYQEHYEGRVGPLELGISRKLELPEHVGSREELAEFFAYLYLVDHASFHPDDDFRTYVDREGRATYTPAQAEARNILMLEALQAADAADLDIYEMALWVGALINNDNEAQAPAWLKALSNTWV